MKKNKTLLSYFIGISALELLAWSSWYDDYLGGVAPLHGWHLYATRLFVSAMFLFVAWLLLIGIYDKGQEEGHREAGDLFDGLVARGVINMDDVFDDARDQIRRASER